MGGTRLVSHRDVNDDMPSKLRWEDHHVSCVYIRDWVTVVARVVCHTAIPSFLARAVLSAVETVRPKQGIMSAVIHNT